MSHVRIRSGVKAFPGGSRALDGIDLEIGRGELLAVVGPSGSGKSTLLRVIAGLESLDSGELLLDGRSAERLPPAEREVAMVFQTPAPYPHLSVAANIAFGLRARGASRAVLRERVAEAAELLGLTRFLDRMPDALSGGERQRVVLARAIARRPQILLLDEPMSSLDAPLRSSTRADLLALHRRFRFTTVLVTHDQAEAFALGDRVAVIDRGRIAQAGAPQELFHHPQTPLVASFLGAPPMNVLACTVEARPGTWLLRLSAAAPKAVVEIARDSDLGSLIREPGPGALGVRPEAVRRVDASEEGGLVLRAPAVRVERGGRETWVTLGLGRTPLVLIAPAFAPVAVGEIVAVRLDLDRASWFNAGGD